ncbi:MAG: response regulator transcription factor [Lewinellaceae bacterium]|nr:response regulator transcription factor [Lewinellaceae bacterium]
MKTIIIDDEPQSKVVLQELLKKHHPEVEVVATGSSVEEGYQLLSRYTPEVVFLDIEMPDGKGFDLLERLDDYSFQAIFVTAYNDYALTAIKFGALDYLLKPISGEDLAIALQKAEKKVKEKISRGQIEILLETLRNFEEKKLPTFIAISTLKGIFYKQVKDIIWLQAEQNCTWFHMNGNPDKILAAINIGEYASQFERYRQFMKVHRAHIVNLYYVQKFVKGDSYLEMEGGAQVSVARPYREELMERLAQL